MARGRGHSPTEALASASTTLRGVGSNDPEALQKAIDEAVAEMEDGLGDTEHFSQTQAADLLGVSKTTLDNWIAKGLIPLQEVENYKRRRVPAKPLLDLAAEVKELRNMGQQRGLLEEAFSRLEQEDPEWKREFEELYGDPDRPFNREDFVSARPGPDWDPED